MKELKTLQQWAEDPRVFVKSQTINRAIKKGHLRAFRPIGGKAWNIYWDDLNEWLHGSTTITKRV